MNIKSYKSFLFIFSILLFSMIAFAGCGGSGDGNGGGTTIPQNESPTMATQYFPLAIGNIWQYYGSVTESNGNAYTEYTYRNSNKIVTINNYAAYIVKNDISTPDDENENFFYSKLDDGIYFHGIY